MKVSMSGWKCSLGASLPSPLRLRPSIFCVSGPEPDERAHRQDDQVTVSDSLAAGQGQEGGVTMHAVMMVGVASRRTVPLELGTI